MKQHTHIGAYASKERSIMRLLFCCDPLNLRRPDPMYELEVAAAQSVGIDYALIHFEALVYEDNPAKAIRAVTPSDRPEVGVFRGWMMKPESYQRLYEALAGRGIYLVNTPAAYQHCHYLPESYAVIEAYTPKTVWIKGGANISTAERMQLLRPFGSSPIIIKDFVKSRKHEWEEACFIPSAADPNAVERVVSRFLELQGEDLNVGLVFREFLAFEPLANHSKSGMPLTKEFRLFFLDGKLMHTTRYWEEGDYEDVYPPVDLFSHIAQNVQSRFFTMDVAKRRDEDEWMIVELGDAQVAGLPEYADAEDFYRALGTGLSVPDPA
jgi:hypothetical protein